MDYLKPLEAAVTYIEDHLGDVRVEDVARSAGYSYYHLTRLFSAVLGESVGSYIKTRRLADAAHKLLYTDKRVIDIALENGFESSEAFSRAFKAVYSVSPIVYRRNRIEVLIAKKKLETDTLRHVAQGITVRPRIVEMDDIKMAGLRGKTTLRDNVIPKLWKAFWTVRGDIPNTTNKSRAFGVCETGNNIYTMNADAVFSEMVGIEVESFGGLPENVEAKTLRGGKYAVFTHTGSLKNIQVTFSYIWGTWLVGSKEQLDCREDFELYDERFLGYDHPNTQIDICIPLR